MIKVRGKFKKNRGLVLLIKVIAVLAIALTIFYFSLNEEAPETTPSSEADELAEKMVSALNKSAFDSLKYLQFEFRGVNQYLWHKPSNSAIVKWDDIEVIMQLDSKEAILYKNGVEINDDSKKEVVDKAWSNWCNDSFWMMAPFKVFDAGTTRSLVKDSISQDSKIGLMVEYQSGGVTPGDKYLWFLDDNYIPTSYKMWVDIIPIGGLEATWEDWKTLKGGSLLSTSHSLKAFDLKLTNVKEADHYSELNYDSDPFENLRN